MVGAGMAGTACRATKARRNRLRQVLEPGDDITVTSTFGEPLSKLWQESNQHGFAWFQSRVATSSPLETGICLGPAARPWAAHLPAPFGCHRLHAVPNHAGRKVIQEIWCPRRNRAVCEWEGESRRHAGAAGRPWGTSRSRFVSRLGPAGAGPLYGPLVCFTRGSGAG